MDNVEYTVNVPEKLDKYFRILSDLFEWGFETPANMYTHFLMDALAAEIVCLRDLVNPHQYEEFMQLIEDAKSDVCPPEENVDKEDL